MTHFNCPDVDLSHEISAGPLIACNLRCIIDMAQSACFCFTLNNYTEEDVGRLCCLPPPYCCLFGKEEAPTTGTKHLQGMIWHDNGVRFRMSTAEKMLGGRCFLVACKDFDAAQGYCVKEVMSTRTAMMLLFCVALSLLLLLCRSATTG